MKVSRIEIAQFRSITDLAIDVEVDGLICVTGANGSGKSTVLRVISMAAAELGVTGGGVTEELNSDGDHYHCEVTFEFSDDLDADAMTELSTWFRSMGVEEDVANWNERMTVVLEARRTAEGVHQNHQVRVEGPFDQWSPQLRDWLRARFDSRSELKMMNLDANRAYLSQPQRQWQTDEIRQLDRLEARKVAAALQSVDLYHQWVKYIAYKDANSLVAARERARRNAKHSGNGPNPLSSYEDPLTALSDLVEKVLPHIHLVGTEVGDDDLFLDSHGKRVSFRSLSGGEREAVFIIGQFYRLQVTRGLLLIDEPELHLNPALIRRLLQLIQESAVEGQVWVATHSFEAIESAGATRTLMLSRSASGCTEASWMSEDLAVVQLAEALGRTGFSVTGTAFVLVEGGGKSLRERSRYESLLRGHGALELVRAGGGKSEVLATLERMGALARQSKGNIQVVAVVDADYGSMDPQSVAVPENAYQLDVHEVENLFLHPSSLEIAVSDLLDDGQAFDAVAAVRDAFEELAGQWIWGRTEWLHNDSWRQESHLEDAKGAKALVSRLDWSQIQTDRERLYTEIRRINSKIWSQVQDSIQAATSIVTSENLWMHCNGKEVLKVVAVSLDFKDEGQRIENLIGSAWASESVARPVQLVSLREFFDDYGLE